MNNINPIAPKVTAIPEATTRLHVSIGELEDVVNSLASRLHPVMEAEMSTLNGVGHAGQAPMHPVPLAGEIHNAADRLHSLGVQLSGLLERLHV